MAWATTGDAFTYTGATVTAAQVEQAQGVVEMFADVTEESITLAPKNLRLLKQAVAYQAAWITQHPDWATNMDTSSINQDQVSATFLHANAGILAPLAKRCIDRLSWNRNRGLKIRRRSDAGQIPRVMNTTNAAADDNDPRWMPIGSGGGPC
jgi:hypothetical protein